jgi:uncharacterized coiled-coil protein SlyX
MGCTNSSQQFNALEQRVRELEDRLQAPNEITQERLLQALASTYGTASNELLRLQKLLKTLQDANSLATSSQSAVRAAQDTAVVSLIQPYSEFTSTNYGIVVLVGYARENLRILRSNGERFEIVNSSEYGNVLGTVSSIVMPGDKFSWVKAEAGEGGNTSSMPKSHCYYLQIAGSAKINSNVNQY